MSENRQAPIEHVGNSRTLVTDARAVAQPTGASSAPQTTATPQTASEPQVTSAAALRAKRRETITNPATGNTYIARRASAETMIKSGILPADFFFEQAKLVTEDETADDATASDDLTPERLAGFKDKNLVRVEEITRAIVSTSLLSPRVVAHVEDENDPNVIEYEDIPLEDRRYIRDWYDYRLDEQKINLEGGAEVTRQEVANFPACERPSKPDRAG